MKLSIVTVCYNNRAGLEKTLNSLRKQTTSDFEHWVVDGASSDGTKAFLENAKVPWDLHWLSEKDSGIYEAMNKGLRKSTGDFVWFLNSGDTCYDSETVATLIKAINEHPDCHIIYGLVLVQNQFGYEVRGHRVRERNFRIGMPISHQAILYKGSIVREQGYLTSYRIISDWVLTRDVFKNESSFYLDRPFAIFDAEGVSSVQHWKMLKEKLHFEKGLYARLRLLLLSGGRYLAIWLSKKVWMYPIYKRFRASVHHLPDHSK